MNPPANPKALPTGNLTRRQLLSRLLLGGALTACGLPVLGAPAERYRIGMTPAFLNNQHLLLDDWRIYLQERLRLPVEFIQRDSYRETMDLLEQGKLDFAWLCDYPFVYLKDLVRLMAAPLTGGRPYYRSYLLVGAADQQRQSMRDLKGAIFAYADPYSNTGYLAPRFRLHELGENYNTFFRKTFFTLSHRKVIAAVADGYAEGGAVDSFVWETLNKVKPELTQRTRIIERSPEFGSPPFAAHRAVSSDDFRRVQSALLDMTKDPVGKALLQRLNLDGFVPGERSMYDGVAKMMRALGE